MDFEFSPEQLAFVEEVEAFLDAHDDPEVFDLTRENMAQIVDTPEAPRVHGEAGRAGLARHDLAEGVRRQGGRGRLRVPAERGAGRPGRPADRQGRRHHRQDHHPPRQREAQGRSSCRRSCATRSSSRSATPSPTPAPTPPRCSSRPPRSTAAGCSTARRPGPPRPTSPSGTGSGARTDPDAQAPRHHPVPRPARPARHHRQRHLDDGRRAHQRGVLRRCVRPRRLRGRRARPRLPVHLRGARPRALHDVHVLADRPAPGPADRVRQEDRRDGGAAADDPVIRRRIA